MISLVTVIGKRLISKIAAAPYPEIAILPEANRAARAVAACCAMLATATKYAWQGWHKEVFGDEVVMEEYPRHHRWEEFRRDPTNSDFAEWKGEGNPLYARIIPETHSKAQLKVALIGLYSRILATDETAKRTGNFIEWMKNNSPADALVKKLMQITNGETAEVALRKIERWAPYTHQYDHAWTLFTETLANQRSSVVLLNYIQQLRGLWIAVGSRLITTPLIHNFVHKIEIK